MYEKFKSFLANDMAFTAVLLMLVGVVSFGLGRLSVQNPGYTTPTVVQTAAAPLAESSSGVVFTEAPTGTKAAVVPTTAPEGVLTTGGVVGSKSGTKYHLPTCPGAKQIKAENKLFFESPAQARAAGYTPAANCPGLQ